MTTTQIAIIQNIIMIEGKFKLVRLIPIFQW